MAAVDSAANALEAVKLSTMKELKGTEKRDSLIANEKKYQEAWSRDRVFQPSAPTFEEIPFQSLTNAEMHEKFPKFFGVMAYPYMNGTLHAGHTLTISKIEFRAGFSRLQGKRVLFPMGYHCTGMAIKACADKLVDEVKWFGQNFEGYSEEQVVEADNAKPKAAAAAREDVTKFTSKKGKSAAKTVKMKYQFQIMKALKIPTEEIHKFADAQYWFHYFPQRCQNDLISLGTRIDWRREMITTDANPYYDSFVRWQMNRLRDLGKIKFGSRYTIYSPKDQQPCMDHDRSEGEAVGPQEYTALKLKVLEWSPTLAETVKSQLPDHAEVFFVPATLRPETMYGQTCCFVGPSITYGVYKASENEYYVITERAARNMAFQGIFQSENGVYEKAFDFKGSDCVGTIVKAPLSVHSQGVRILPMESVLATKGTGVVTSVPSDSPDDYATVMDLAKKADYYGIKKEWVELEMVSVITTPSYGDFTAQFLVKKLKITSPKDTKQLEEAKELAYKEGYYQGIMNYGDFKGEKVEDAKPKVRQQLLESKEGFAYAEPEKRVVSRSADECVVALMDQWYLDYGEDSWRTIALDHVANTMESYSDETKNAFQGVLNWLNKWACARTYGHGSKLPWDPKFMVESLSDSTIYMAYYTVAHYLHSDPYGQTTGIGHITADQMTDEVWDYIFARENISEESLKASKIPKGTLDTMRREFEYWYPVDVNVSGKDLLPNHLTFFIYNHLAIWSQQQEFWPQAVRANGHLLLNGEKMAKSTGNFMTLEELVGKFGADASRIAIADAGDGVADANFEEDVADNNILRLYNLREWCEDQVKNQSKLRSGPLDSFFDKLFDNEMNAIIHEAYTHYDATNYKLALKSALYDFTSARDFYREATNASAIAMHKDLVFKYIETQALLLSVIAPHWSEQIWLEVLGKPTTIQNALYPTVPHADSTLSAVREYIRNTTSNITSAEAAQQKKKAKKDTSVDPTKSKDVTIFVASKFPAWQEKYVDLIVKYWDEKSKTINDTEMMKEMKRTAGPEMKKAMQFVQGLKRQLLAGVDKSIVLERTLPFDELSTLQEMTALLKRAAGLKEVVIIQVDDGGKTGTIVGDGKKVDDLLIMAASAVPGVPTFSFGHL